MNTQIKGNPKVVAFGGGTGMPVLLRGLKNRISNLTAVVVVSDDGGSSGELRSLYDMPAPGDLRNVIAALGEAHPTLLSLIQYRFSDPLLEGHSLGNLALAALMKIEGNFEKAIQALCELAQVKARVIPMAYQKLALVATHQDGSKSTGEVRVSQSGKPISRMCLVPEPSPASGECLQAIEEADVILLGPGSLFTSVIPHLLIPGVAEALKKCRGKLIYVANIMTEPGETTEFSLNDHIQALFEHGLEELDAVIAHNGNIPEALRERYKEAGASVVPPSDLPESVHLQIDDLLEEGEKLRHSPRALADSFFKCYQELVA